MKYAFAPMEGLTDSVYRRTHHRYFPGVDRYGMPFLSPTVHRCLTPREARELPRADAEPFQAVPQLMTRVPEDFLWAAGVCRDLGYEEVELNLGCPSGTVTAKGKGSGMLRDPQGLDRFLEAVYAHAPLPISLKTRLGYADPQEFPALLEIYNRYPVHRLTVHPRVRQAFYAGPVDLEAFRYAAEHAKMPLCRNGDICTQEDIQGVQKEYPGLEGIMIGRGLIADPGLLTPGGTQRQTLGAFMEELLEQYRQAFGSTRNAMFRLKENWRMILSVHPVPDKLRKKLLKTTDEEEYRQLTHALLEEMEF